MDVFHHLRQRSPNTPSREIAAIDQAINTLKEIKQTQDYEKIHDVVGTLRDISPPISRNQSSEDFLKLIKFDKDVIGC